MTTKLEQAEAIIMKVEQMRRLQKEYFAHRDGLVLRKAKEIEKELDTMLTAYRGDNDTKTNNNQLNIFEQ